MLEILYIITCKAGTSACDFKRQAMQLVCLHTTTSFAVHLGPPCADALGWQ